MNDCVCVRDDTTITVRQDTEEGSSPRYAAALYGISLPGEQRLLRSS